MPPPPGATLWGGKCVENLESRQAWTSALLNLNTKQRCIGGKFAKKGAK
ncbi:hypothetical protein HMPREF0578_1711 [Mobiluncus mulieris 28-1]|nr:hypothetical protein HMPREF0578_1711 [Mobiluncus mulieris 28-1]